LFHRLASLHRASFGPRLAASVVSPLRFAIPSPPSGCVEDFHLRVVEHAQRTKEKAPRARSREEPRKESLQPLKTRIGRITVYRAGRRHRETGSVLPRRG
jgi:hypothetical protein